MLAKDLKEAQTYGTAVAVLLMLIVASVGQIPQLAAGWAYLVPIMNVSILIGDAVANKVSTMKLVILAGSNLFATALVLVLAVRLFRSERIMLKGT